MNLPLRPDHPLALGEPPPAASVEQWAFDFLTATSLTEKLRPPPVPDVWLPASSAAMPVPVMPGRPKELRVVERVPRSRGGSVKGSARARNRLLHAFLHHELQAAELMAWALLRFSKSEPAFRRGLLNICQDELRHLQLYLALLGSRGVDVSDFPVRDWFWDRVPTCSTPLQFVSLMGLGVEAANLEHCERFAQAFAEAGDHEAASLQRQIEHEEVAHVAFGRYWFERWQGRLEFDAWKRQLPKPLSPLLMRALPLNRAARGRAGMGDEFLHALANWTPDDTRE